MQWKFRQNAILWIFTYINITANKSTNLRKGIMTNVFLQHSCCHSKSSWLRSTIKTVFWCFDATMLLKLALACVLPMFNRRSTFLKKYSNTFCRSVKIPFPWRYFPYGKFFGLYPSGCFTKLQKYNTKFMGCQNLYIP